MSKDTFAILKTHANLQASANLSSGCRDEAYYCL